MKGRFQGELSQVCRYENLIFVKFKARSLKFKNSYLCGINYAVRFDAPFSQTLPFLDANDLSLGLFQRSVGFPDF